MAERPSLDEIFGGGGGSTGGRPSLESIFGPQEQQEQPDSALQGWDPHREEEGSLGMHTRAATELWGGPGSGKPPVSFTGDVTDAAKTIWGALVSPRTAYTSIGQAFQGMGDTASEFYSALKKEFGDKYGTTDRIRHTYETDPAGFLLDASTVVTGAAGLGRKGTELGVKGLRRAIPSIGGVTGKVTSEDLRLAGEAGLMGGAQGAEYKAGVQGRLLQSDRPPPSAAMGPPPSDVLETGAPKIEGRVGAAEQLEAREALKRQRETSIAEGDAAHAAAIAETEPYGQAGRRLGGAGANPWAILSGGLIGGRLGAAAGAAASSPQAIGGAMYGLGAAERGMGRAPVISRAAIKAGALALLRDRDAKKDLSNAELKTVRAARDDDADSKTMQAAQRILQQRPELTGKTPLALPGQSRGLGASYGAYGPSDAPKHGGKTLPEFVMQQYWDHLRGLPGKARESAMGAAEGDPERFDPSSTLGMARMATTGGMPFARPGTLGVSGGRITQPGGETAAKNVHGLVPDLRVKVGVDPATLPEKPLFTQNTTNANAPKQLENIDAVLTKHPAPEASPEAWSQMMAHALATDDVPVPPYAFIRDINGAGAADKIKSLSPGQIADANHGFENTAKTRQAYEGGRVSPVQTGKLFLWSFLSRGVSPYTQESLFLDAFHKVGPWIEKAVAGKFTEKDVPAYLKAMEEAAPKGSGQPGAGATHNLNAFGSNFLLKMSKPGEDGKTPLLRLHELLSDPSKTGPQIRREFAKVSEGVGIDNKVMSFTLLATGHNDVMVIDRVQLRQMWDDGRFAGRNIYDGVKDAEGKVQIGTPMSTMTYGARGLLQYEAIERALGKKIKEIYTQAGRPQDGSIGRYHWETWVAHSQQEASHGTLEAIFDPTKISKVSAKQGEYGAYEYGARYKRDKGGTPYFSYQTPSGKSYNMTLPRYRAFLEAIKKPSSGVVPSGFKVTEAGNAPWYRRPEVDQKRLEALAKEAAAGKR